MAVAELKVNIVSTNEPSDRVSLDIAGTRITIPANDVLELMLDRVRRPAGSRAVPAIGQRLPGQGGIYAGVARGCNGNPDYHLVVAEEQRAEIDWPSALTWAKDLAGDGLTDFTLPSRPEQAILFGTVPELFEKAWYWSDTAHSNPESAWCQGFRTGYQSDHLKGARLRARAVRRVPIW